MSLVTATRHGEMKMAKNRQTAIVTGASRGIGAAIPQRVAADGFRRRRQLCRGCRVGTRKHRKAGGRAISIKADVSDAEAVRRRFDQAETAFGGIDVLVNNAGIMPLATFKDTRDAFVRRHSRHRSEGCVQRHARGG
jgi:3-oxoacyl-[acyl-carrier protein] reductase